MSPPPAKKPKRTRGVSIGATKFKTWRTKGTLLKCTKFRKPKHYVESTHQTFHLTISSNQSDAEQADAHAGQPADNLQDDLDFSCLGEEDPPFLQDQQPPQQDHQVPDLLEEDPPFDQDSDWEDEPEMHDVEWQQEDTDDETFSAKIQLGTCDGTFSSKFCNKVLRHRISKTGAVALYKLYNTLQVTRNPREKRDLYQGKNYNAVIENKKKLIPKPMFDYCMLLPVPQPPDPPLTAQERTKWTRGLPKLPRKQGAGKKIGQAGYLKVISAQLLFLRIVL